MDLFAVVILSRILISL